MPSVNCLNASEMEGPDMTVEVAAPFQSLRFYGFNFFYTLQLQQVLVKFIYLPLISLYDSRSSRAIPIAPLLWVSFFYTLQLQQVLVKFIYLPLISL